ISSAQRLRVCENFSSVVEKIATLRSPSHTYTTKLTCTTLQKLPPDKRICTRRLVLPRLRSTQLSVSPFGKNTGLLNMCGFSPVPTASTSVTSLLFHCQVEPPCVC